MVVACGGGCGGGGMWWWHVVVACGGGMWWWHVVVVVVCRSGFVASMKHLEQLQQHGVAGLLGGVVHGRLACGGVVVLIC